MTRGQAALRLALHLSSLGMLMPEDWLKKNGEGSELYEAFQIAVEVLRGCRNGPLTLDELRKMDGEPVWIEFIDPKETCPPHWRIWNTHECQHWELDGYGKYWLAYHQKPEEGRLT